MQPFSRRPTGVPIVLFGLLLAACGTDARNDDIASARVGPTGGSVALGDDVAITFAPGALESEQTITIRRTDDDGPAGWRRLSPVYRFEPAGLEFTSPVTVTIAMQAQAPEAQLVWTTRDAAGWESVGGVVRDGAITATVEHFSDGFVGAPRAVEPDGGPSFDGGVVDGGGDPSCTAGQVACSGVCVTLQDNPANCGACGRTCGGDMICIGNDCVPPCEGSLVWCNVCVDTQSDPNNCGGCGFACESLRCEAGQCIVDVDGGVPDGGPDSVCAPPRVVCGGACVDTEADPANCGECGYECSRSQVCRTGVCVAVDGGPPVDSGPDDAADGGPLSDGGTTCGNGAIDIGEECDGTDLGGATCTSVGGSPPGPWPFSHGTLACTPTCEFDTSRCYWCRNGTVDPGEECDFTDMPRAECGFLFGYDGGALQCTECQYDTSLCQCYTDRCRNCRNGAIDAGEQCDGGNLGGATCVSRGHAGGVLACSVFCEFDERACTD